MPATPQERSLHGRLAAAEKWAQTADRSAATTAARAAADNRFERQVDPDGLLDPAERARRAEYAKKAHYLRMALKSAQSRRKAVEAREGWAVTAGKIAEAEAEAGLTSGGAA